MCLGIPGEVQEVLADRPDLARVTVNGSAQLINVGLIEDELLEPGDWILIHMGFALSRIDQDEAYAALDFLEGLGQENQNAMAALTRTVQPSPSGER